MTDHTEGPWVQHEMGQRIFIGPGSTSPINVREVVIAFNLEDLTKAAEQRWRDHAARIVATHNACAGIPTARLEDYWTKAVATLTEQNWDRLAACAKACAGIPTGQLKPGSVANALDKLEKMENISHHKRAWELAAAALAPFRETET